jgi:hypothetical protein
LRKIRGLSLLQGMSKNFINRLIPLSLLTLAVAACIPITPQPAGIGQPEPAMPPAVCHDNANPQAAPVRAIVTTRRLPDDSYKFNVEFTYTDGALFKQGPCCGDTGPSISTFDYTVTRSGNSWKVMELPPYVP